MWADTRLVAQFLLIASCKRGALDLLTLYGVGDDERVSVEGSTESNESPGRVPQIGGRVPRVGLDHNAVCGYAISIDQRLPHLQRLGKSRASRMNSPAGDNDIGCRACEKSDGRQTHSQLASCAERRGEIIRPRSGHRTEP